MSETTQPKTTTAQALAIVRAAGYVAVKAKSYTQAQERQRLAEVRATCEAQAAEHARVWAANCLDAERSLAERITFVYGVARAFGASVADLSGPLGLALDAGRVPVRATVAGVDPPENDTSEVPVLAPSIADVFSLPEPPRDDWSLVGDVGSEPTRKHWLTDRRVA